MKDAATVKHPATAESMGHAIYENARSAIKSAGEMIAQYRKVHEQVAAVGEKVKRGNHDWEGDCQTLQNILHKQGEKAKLEVKRLLQGDVEDAEEKLLSEADEDLWTRFAVTSTEEERMAVKDPEQGWAVAARKARRSVHRMVRDLPEDSE